MDFRRSVSLLALLVAACATPKSATVRMPGGAEAPAATDSAFVAVIDSLIAAGEGYAEFVCVLQYEKRESPPHTDRFVPLEDAGQDVWIIRADAIAIEEYRHNPNLRFIGPYKPGYKYNRTLADAGVTWVYVESFRDDQPEFHEEMAGLGIERIRYLRVPGYYYCKATGEQIVSLADSWWVRRIYRAHRRFTSGW